MAPEQLMGGDIDERADIFSIGAIMYELFAYRRPFDGDTISQVMGQVMNTNPGDIEGVDTAINFMIKHALEKDRTKRYGTVKELTANVEQLLNYQKKKQVKTRSIIDQTITSQIKDVRAQLRKIERMKAKISSHLEKASQALKQSQFEEAITYAEKILELDNAHQQAEKILTHAKKFLKLKKEEEEHKMKWIRERLLEAQGCMDESHYLRACELCESILKVEPEHNDARVIKAVCIKKIREFLEKVEKSDHI